MINFFLNQVLPPVIRDSVVFMKPLFVAAFGRRLGKLFMEFRENAPHLSPSGIARYYRETSESDLKKCSDLSQECFKAISENVAGTRLLDAGCGRGALMRRFMDQGYTVFGCDVSSRQNGNVVEARLEALPFSDRAFDTVVCSHVLEHIPDIISSIKELRRVAAERLIIVLPIERPYAFGFNLHVWFFPYEYSVRNMLRLAGCQRLAVYRLGAEWLCVEDISDGEHPKQGVSSPG